MTKNRRPRLAILGSRGIPAEFGGFETFAEQLAVRLVERGWDVTVFCEPSQTYREPEYKRVTLKYVCTPEITGVRSIWFDLMGMLRTLRGYDIVYMLGYHAAFAFFLPRLLGTNFWVNTDGLEWHRSKWSPRVQRYLKTMEGLAARFAPHLVADAQGIADHLAASYPAARGKTRVLEYGAYLIDTPPPTDTLTRFGLRPRDYYLVVCRLEPENHVLDIVVGYLASKSPHRLVIVGDRTTDTPYVRSLLAAGDGGVQFVGTIFDQEVLTALRYHCRAYFHGHSVGGTNPSLLEAMACGNYVVAHDNPFNREVTQDLCAYFADAAEMALRIRALERDGIPEAVPGRLRRLIDEKYNWDRIAERYAAAFGESLGRGPSRRPETQ
jgi:glycosyltransferase involved in cell wall biosynthesis